MDKSSPIKWLIRIAVMLALLLAAGIPAAWWGARPPVPDAFYQPQSVEAGPAGQLLRAEPFTRDVPTGAKAWRILYTTTRADERAALASAIVLLPSDASAHARPVIAWAHGTTGIVAGCAPSLMTHPFLNVPALEAALKKGWAFVASDYVGLGTEGGHAYLVGDDAARAVLDAVRAARQIGGAQISSNVVVWGHSQGGNSALWSGIRAADYAPDLELKGVAALAPATDLVQLFTQGQSTMFGKIVSAYMLSAYAQTYADIDVNIYAKSGTGFIMRDIAGRCVGGVETLFSVAETFLLPPSGLFSQSPAQGALGKRLLQNTPNIVIAAPVLIAQGEADDLVLPLVQKQYARARCAEGQSLEFQLYPGRDHLSLVSTDSPLTADLIAWTAARFGNAAPTPNCAVLDDLSD